MYEWKSKSEDDSQEDDEKIEKFILCIIPLLAAGYRGSRKNVNFSIELNSFHAVVVAGCCGTRRIFHQKTADCEEFANLCGDLNSFVPGDYASVCAIKVKRDIR